MVLAFHPDPPGGGGVETDATPLASTLTQLTRPRGLAARRTGRQPLQGIAGGIPYQAEQGNIDCEQGTFPQQQGPPSPLNECPQPLPRLIERQHLGDVSLFRRLASVDVDKGLAISVEHLEPSWRLLDLPGRGGESGVVMFLGASHSCPPKPRVASRGNAPRSWAGSCPTIA